MLRASVTPVMWRGEEGTHDGPPLVLLPDASRPAGWWPEPLVARLAGQGWRIVRCDYPDQGRSAPWTAPARLGDLVVGVGRLLAATSAPAPTRRAVLVGVGLGGTVALAAGLAYPERVRRVVVVGTSAWLADPEVLGPDEVLVVSLIWRRRDGVVDDRELAAVLGREYRSLCSAADRPSPAEAAAEVDRWLAWGFNPADTHRQLWLGAPDLRDDLAALRTPLHVVHGVDDPLVPVGHAERLSQLVPGAELTVVPGAGHELRPDLSAAIAVAVGAPETVG
jgi:pimeloyl-ACP methyl ester carboxylesterase